jgi:polyisoprenoid-binding protein YceI
MRRFILISFMFTMAATAGVFAQNTYRLAQANSSLVVMGTSTLHDWEMSARNITANMTVNKDGTSIQKIENVYFSVKSDNIVSDNSIMDSKAHDALKAEKYPTISFNMASVNNLVSSGNTIKGSLSGNVTIAGVTKNITLPFTGTLQGNGIQVTGSKSLKMSDFNIKPPTAMLGTLKTGDEIKIDYKLEFTD